jgi:hypothetical protein
MNASGVAAFQIEFADDPTHTAIYTGTPGSITLIADSGDALSGGTVCSIEPFPLINANNQVFFGTSLVSGVACNENNNVEDEGTKGVYRFTPPATIERLLLAAANGSGDQITTSDTDFVSSSTTFDIVDAHIINFGGDAAGSNGGIMVTAALRPDGSTDPCFEADSGVCERALLYLGPTPGAIQLIALEGPNSIFEDKKIKGVANNLGQALFKAQEADLEGLAGNASLQTWTSGGGLTELVGTGDAVPGSQAGGTFGGFNPHVDVNDTGNAAFTAGLNLGASCNGGDPITGFGSSSASQNRCRGVYYAPAGGGLTEIARTTTAAAAEAGAPSSLGGFNFEVIGSVAVVDQCNTVYFVAENNDADELCGVPPTGSNTPAYGGGGGGSSSGDVTGIFAWNSGTLTKLIAEGDTVPDGRVMRLFTAMPELRQNVENQRFAIRAWIDTDADCDADIEETLVATIGVGCGVLPSPTPTNTLVPGQPTSTPTNTPTVTPTRTPIIGGGPLPPEIPALGPSGLWLLIGVLALLGALMLWRRGN